MTDEDLEKTIQLLFDWIQGRNKISREILYILPESAQEILEKLEISEIKDICEYVFFPAEEELIQTNLSNTEIDFFTNQH